jgi:hypothetical protein
MHYGSFKLLPSAFAAKFELLVNEKKKFWRRGSRGRRLLGLCGHNRNVRQQIKNHSKKWRCAFHVGNLQSARNAAVLRRKESKTFA